MSANSDTMILSIHVACSIKVIISLMKYQYNINSSTLSDFSFDSLSSVYEQANPFENEFWYGVDHEHSTESTHFLCHVILQDCNNNEDGNNLHHRK